MSVEAHVDAPTTRATERIRAGEGPMRRDDVLAVLRAHRPVLTERFGLSKLRLYGSVAREQAEADSDLDLLVQFDGEASPKMYFGLMFYLEDLLEREIDLVMESVLRREFRPYVEREAIDV